MSFKKYLVFRTLQTIVMLWLVLTALFVLFRSMPGDFTVQMAVAGADEATLQRIRERWGLNDPLYIQYWNYLKNFVQLNMGESPVYRVDVWEFTKMRIFNTFILVAPAITFTYILGAVIGTIFGTRRGTRLEKFGLIPVIGVSAFPEFFIAIVLIIVFASWLGWFPTSGMLSPGITQQYDTWWRPYLTKNFGHHYILPFVAVVFRYMFIPSLIMRTSVVEVIGQDFTEYHRITGMPQLEQLRQIAKHSILPLITIYPVSMARALGGLVLIETVFNWPGIGWTLVEAVLGRDVPILMFIFFIVAAFIIVSNFIVDLIYGVIDPRIRITD